MKRSYSGIRSQLQKSSKKRPLLARRAGHDAARAGALKVALDPRRHQSDLGRRERRAHADGAVAAKVGDRGLAEHAREFRWCNADDTVLDASAETA